MTSDAFTANNCTRNIDVLCENSSRRLVNTKKIMHYIPISNWFLRKAGCATSLHLPSHPTIAYKLLMLIKKAFHLFKNALILKRHSQTLLRIFVAKILCLKLVNETFWNTLTKSYLNYISGYSLKFLPMHVEKIFLWILVSDTDFWINTGAYCR